MKLTAALRLEFRKLPPSPIALTCTEWLPTLRPARLKDVAVVILLMAVPPTYTRYPSAFATVFQLRVVPVMDSPVGAGS